nr:NADH dehydrogenase subunit 3 [Antarctophthirus microchir]
MVSLFTFFTILLTFYNHTDPWNQNEPYECGFDQLGPNRAPFNLYFYCLGVMYFVFDVELVVTLPLVMLNCTPVLWHGIWLFYGMVMLTGLYLETLIGNLDWVR